MAAQDKARVLKAWERFLRSGFKPHYFTEELYRHLSLRCSFIAHYNRSGFYSTYFEDPEATIRFLNQFDSDHGFASVEYGSTWWLEGEYADINRAMCEVVEKVKGRLYEELSRKARGRDLALASQLLAKHGILYEPTGSSDRACGPTLQSATEWQ
jgi:hypothetical protein